MPEAFVGIDRARRATIALAALASLTLAGCMNVSVHTTGAGSVEDLQAENAYVELYMKHMTATATDLKLFAPNGSDPGPCNIGGSRQDCYDADARVIADLSSMLSALEGTTVPPRFVDADRRLRDALTKNIEGLDLRNRAIETSDNTLWQQANRAIDDAGTAWTAAYAAFPADHTPALGP